MQLFVYRAESYLSPELHLTFAEALSKQSFQAHLKKANVPYNNNNGRGKTTNLIAVNEFSHKNVAGQIYILECQA